MEKRRKAQAAERNFPASRMLCVVMPLHEWPATGSLPPANVIGLLESYSVPCTSSNPRSLLLKKVAPTHASDLRQVH